MAHEVTWIRAEGGTFEFSSDGEILVVFRPRTKEIGDAYEERLKGMSEPEIANELIEVLMHFEELDAIQGTPQ